MGFNLYGKGIDEILERGAYGTDNQWHWYYFQQDHEGSVTHLTDWTGAIIERYRYDAFGAPAIYAPNWTVRTGSSYGNRFLFTGREYDGAWVYQYPSASLPLRPGPVHERRPKALRRRRLQPLPLLP